MFILKRSFVVTSVSALLLAASCGSQAAAPTSATITFTAKVINNTCEFDGAGNQTVAFNSVDLAKLKSGTPEEKEFHLKLKNCAGGIKVDVNATGADVDSGTGIVPNPTTVAANAKNVGVSILDDTTVLKIATYSKKFSESSGSIDIPLKARLQKIGSSEPTAGDVSIVMTVGLQYE